MGVIDADELVVRVLQLLFEPQEQPGIDREPILPTLRCDVVRLHRPNQHDTVVRTPADEQAARLARKLPEGVIRQRGGDGRRDRDDQGAVVTRAGVTEPAAKLLTSGFSPSNSASFARTIPATPMT